MATQAARGKNNGTRRSTGLTIFLLAALLGSAAVACVFLGGRQYVLLQYYDEIDAMQGEVLSLQQEVRLIHQKVHRASRDPFWTEKIAREHMNFAAPGELIFRFEEVD
jgi:cell division protein FtsB